MQENGGFRLIVRRGPQPNQTFDLNKDIVTLGRDITNDIVINDPEVSRHHLRLTRGADGYSIEDLGSTNGTFIAGQRLSGVRQLQRADVIGLGETVTLIYEAVRAEVSSPPPTAQSPMPSQPVQPPPQPAQQAPQQDYGQPQSQQPGYGYNEPSPQDPAYYGAPPPQQDYGYEQGYDSEYGYGPGGSSPGYDPYAIREEGAASPWRWVIIGCSALFLFCCCATVIGLVLIDAANLWCRLPIFREVITPLFGIIGEALGIIDQAQIC